MEFLSPKTKERIAKLEQENAQLKAAAQSQQEKSSGALAWLPWGLVVISSAIAVFLFLRPSGPSAEEVGAMQVEMWRNGEVVDTVLKPTTGLVFSIQVGAYKNLDMSELSHGLSAMSFAQDSAYTRIKLGQYASLPEAQEFLELVINMGFERAFIVAYKDDNAVGLLSNKTALN